MGANANIERDRRDGELRWREKHRTTIAANAMIGSGAILVAPVTIGEGATIGANAVVTKGQGRGRGPDRRRYPRPPLAESGLTVSIDADQPALLGGAGPAPPWLIGLASLATFSSCRRQAKADPLIFHGVRGAVLVLSTSTGSNASKRLSTVKEQGHRAVIDELDLHHGPEDPGGHGESSRGNPLDEATIEAVGLGRLRRVDEAGPPAGSTVTEQGELADDEHTPPTSATLRFILP